MAPDLIDILTFRAGYNTTVVVIGATLLGVGGGVTGVFALLRRRALISDAISHATLPGVAGAFLVALALGLDGRNMAALLLGACLSGALGVLAVQWMRDHTRLPEDAAIGTVLSVFFGLGIVLLSYIQTLSAAGQAGLEGYLLGSTASMLRHEAELIGIAAAVVVVLALLFLKEFGLVCFDPDYAAARGWSIARIDLLMMALLLTVVAIGLKTVGLILIIALVIIPPVAARFWTERLGPMVAISALIGGLACWLGAALSALWPDLPSGAMIVLTGSALFVLSLLLAPARGLLANATRQLHFRLLVGQRQVLLAVAAGRPAPDPLARRLLTGRGLLTADGGLTDAGRQAAARLRRDQALWDRYLADHPAEALLTRAWALHPIERVLPADVVADLERRVAGDAAGGEPTPCR